MKVSLSAIALAASLFAVGGASAQQSTRFATAKVPSTQSVVDADSGSTLIFSTLGPVDDVYNGQGGWIVAGPDDTYTNQQQDVAIPFTPKANSTVTQIKLPIQYYDYGTNNGTIEIAADNAGVPGKILAKQDVKGLPDFGIGCCKLSVWNLTTGLEVSAATQYWIIATTDKESTTSAYVWDYNWKGTISSIGVQDNLGGWGVLTFLVSPTAAVYGTLR